MIKRIIATITLTLLSAAAVAAGTEHVMVITRQETPVNNITKSQLRNIYMGNLAVADITPLSLEPGEVSRSVFNVRVIGLTESRIQAYWAQMRFSGRQQRPQEAPSIEQLLLMVQSTPNTIGYVPEDTALPEGVKIIFKSSAQ